MDVHGPMQCADQGALIGTQRLVSSIDGFCFPVGPVDVLLKQRHGKDVRDVLAQNCKPQTTYLSFHKEALCFYAIL